jgi:hypothetical protein
MDIPGALVSSLEIESRLGVLRYLMCLRKFEVEVKRVWGMKVFGSGSICGVGELITLFE